MDRESQSATRIYLRNVLIFVLFTFFLGAAQAQTTHAKTNSESSVQQELVRTENGFFEAWKTKDQAYFREHMLENGIFWGDTGTLSRDQGLAEQQASAKTCTIEGYGLSDFGALPLAAGAYLLTYRAEEYATCNGEKVPVYVNGSSIYVLRSGRWQAIYRAQVALKNPG
jgi:hypothetical protein